MRQLLVKQVKKGYTQSGLDLMGEIDSSPQDATYPAGRFIEVALPVEIPEGIYSISVLFDDMAIAKSARLVGPSTVLVDAILFAPLTWSKVKVRFSEPILFRVTAEEDFPKSKAIVSLNGQPIGEFHNIKFQPAGKGANPPPPIEVVPTTMTDMTISVETEITTKNNQPLEEAIQRVMGGPLVMDTKPKKAKKRTKK